MVYYNKLKKVFREKFLIFGYLICSISVNAQEADLGMEYMKAGEYEKAKVVFQKLVKNKEAAKSVHKSYLQTLIKLKEFDEAEKFLKKQIKNTDANARYIADYARLLAMEEKNMDAQKQYDIAMDKVKYNEEAMMELIDDFSLNQQFDLAVQTIEKAREHSNSMDRYALQLAKLYRIQNKIAQMIEEYLNFGLTTDNQEMVQSILQDELKEEKEIEQLEKILYTDVQKYPNQIFYNEVLIWHLIQKKQFYKAFIQVRSLDRRYRKDGIQVTDLGFLAHQNKDYINSGKVFEYLVKEYPKSQNYPLWRRMLINAKEEVIKTVYPINVEDIRLLIAEYTKILEELGTNQKTLEAVRSKGLLYAFYLNEKDTAIVVLENAIKLANGDQQFIDRCKLDLGDVYLLKSEPWEATLLYSQVEKSEKDSPLGYDAKLRNAKLAYFRGDFELSKEVLDILKQATTREIANDAMELSLLIMENTGVDSSEKAMKAYSNVELLLFQHRNEEAVDNLNSMERIYKGDPLEDDIIYLRALTYLKKGDTDKGVKDLETIIQKFPVELKGDDATYNLAKIYQEKLNQPAKAMKLYQDLLTKYPGSIYGADARKRFRNLRGDTIN